MGGNGTRGALFAHWLNSKMSERGLSKRALGRLIDPENPARGRRQVLRHTSGSKPHFPSRRSRAAYAEVFGPLPVEFVDDDEESDPVSLEAQLHQIARAHRDLGRALQRAGRLLAKETV